jgi:hypothetical protein
MAKEKQRGRVETFFEGSLFPVIIIRPNPDNTPIYYIGLLALQLPLT